MTTTSYPVTPWPFPLIEIRWKDAKTDDKAWTSFGDEPELPIIHTVGWLVKETEEAFYVSATVGTEKKDNDEQRLTDMGQLFLIPKGMLVAMRRIEPRDAIWVETRVTVNDAVFIQQDKLIEGAGFGQ